MSDIHVIVNARGWHGSFNIPERHFKELTTYLAERAEPPTLFDDAEFAAEARGESPPMSTRPEL